MKNLNKSLSIFSEHKEFEQISDLNIPDPDPGYEISDPPESETQNLMKYLFFARVKVNEQIRGGGQKHVVYITWTEI